MISAAPRRRAGRALGLLLLILLLSGSGRTSPGRQESSSAEGGPGASSFSPAPQLLPAKGRREGRQRGGQPALVFHDVQCSGCSSAAGKGLAPKRQRGGRGG